jgi:hypothetical protein
MEEPEFMNVCCKMQILFIKLFQCMYSEDGILVTELWVN